MNLKERIEQVLSEILSDRYLVKATLRFVPKNGEDHSSGEKTEYSEKGATGNGEGAGIMRRGVA